MEQRKTINVKFDFSPFQWQKKCYDKLKRFNVFVVHRRAGKTWMAIMYLIECALRFTGKDGRFAFISPYLTQAVDIAWTLLSSQAAMVPGTQIDKIDHSITFPNGARIKLHGADNPEGLRGRYLDGVVLDELADVKAQVWGEILVPMLNNPGRSPGWAMLIGTPKGINLLSERYYAAQEDPDWYAEKFTIYDTQTYTQAEIDNLKKNMNERQFAQEYLCDFAAGNESALITANQIEDSCQRPLDIPSYDFAPIVIGVDVARQGDDSSVIQIRQGLFCHEPIAMKLNDSMQVAAKVIEAISDLKLKQNNSTVAAIFVDGSGGYGAGVIDRLRQLSYRVTEVQFGGKPTDERFNNKRTEMWWGIKYWIEQGGKLPVNPRLKRDLAAPQYTHANSAGKMALESKENLKKRLTFSPDYGDALALTFAYPVNAPSIEEQRVYRRQETQPQAYDPWKSEGWKL